MVKLYDADVLDLSTICAPPFAQYVLLTLTLRQRYRFVPVTSESVKDGRTKTHKRSTPIEIRQRHVDACLASGLSQRSYARRNNLDQTTFQVWVRQLSGQAPHRHTVDPITRAACLADIAGGQRMSAVAKHHQVSRKAIYEWIRQQKKEASGGVG